MAMIALTIASTTIGKSSAHDSQALSDAGTPPSLGLNSYAGQVASMMRRELFDLADQEARAPQLDQQILRASLNVRRLAVELLEQGEREGADGSLGVVIGLRLFHGRDELDHALNGLVPLSRGLKAGSAPSELVERFNSAVEALRRFNERALVIPAELPVNDPVALDSFVASLMSGLIPAVELTSLERVVNHWISSRATTPTPAMIAAGLDQRAESSSSQAQTLEQLVARVNTTTIRADTREQLAAILATLQRGAAFAELRPNIETYRALLSKTIDFADALVSAEWLDKDVQDILADQLHHAVVLFQDKQTRDSGEQRLEHLVALRTILLRTSILAQSRVGVRPISRALATLTEPIDDPASNPDSPFSKTSVAAIERMIAYRELKVPKLQGELRVVRRKLDDHYRLAERALFSQLQTVSENADALTDPSLTSLFADHQQYLEDLRRIEQLPIWIDQLSLIAPRSAGSVKVHVEKLSRWLLDPTRRPDGVRALDRLQQQLRLFYPLPFERRMRRADREVITATGARHVQLLQVIDTRRREWVESLVDRDDDGQASKRMRLLFRLTQTLADVVELLRLTSDAPALDRWAAWELPTDAIRKTVADLPARLKLATTAAIDENDRSLRVQLERIDRDAPLGKLAGRLGQVLAEALEELPDGALAVVGQSANTPTDDAWMRLSRRELANLCRYTMEQQHAESTGQDSLADTLSVYVNSLAEQLLADLGE